MHLLFVLAVAASIQPVVDSDKVVRCVREPVTGFIAKTRRVCHTVGEWRRIRDDARAEACRIFRDGQSRISSN